MNVYIATLIFVGTVLAIQLISCVWLARAVPDKLVVNKYSYFKMLSLIVPLYKSWAKNFEESDLPIIKEYRRRLIIFIYPIFLLPYVIYWAIIYILYYQGS